MEPARQSENVRCRWSMRSVLDGTLESETETRTHGGGGGGRQCNAQLDGGRRVCKREREREKIEEEKREKGEKRDAGSL